MSKSLGNYIGINEPADDMFVKLMSISDELMWRYFELLSFRPQDDIRRLQGEVAGGANPRAARFPRAKEIVNRFQGAGAGERAGGVFMARFQKGQIPDDMPEFMLV